MARSVRVTIPKTEAPAPVLPDSGWGVSFHLKEAEI